MISLKLIYNDGEKESLVFNQPVITIGRSSDNDVSLISANGVSRHHAKLYQEGDVLIVEDLNSTNGTYLNSQKITKSAVEQKDVIEIGSVCIKGLISNLAESSESKPRQELAAVGSRDPLELLKLFIPEALQKIQDRNVYKVLIRPNSRVKFFEQGREVELELLYSNDDLMRLAESLKVNSLSRFKIATNISCSIVSSSLSNLGVCICFEKVSDDFFSLEEYLSQGVCCRDTEKILTEAYARGKNIVFSGPDRRVIQGLMQALMDEKDSRVCFMDRFARLSAAKESLSFSAKCSSELVDCAQFAIDSGIQRFFIDDLTFYEKSGLSLFSGMFQKGGIAFVEFSNVHKMQANVADICGYGSDFWSHVLVWFEKSSSSVTIKNIYKAASSDIGVEFVEIFGK